MKPDSQAVYFDETGNPIDSVEFDYDEIDRRLNGEEQEKSCFEPDALIAMWDWTLQPEPTCSIPMCDQPLAKHLVIIWCIAPHLLGNPTETELAESRGWKKQKLSILVRIFEQKWNIHTRGMKTGTAIDAYKVRFQRIRDIEAIQRMADEKQGKLL